MLYRVLVKYNRRWQAVFIKFATESNEWTYGVIDDKDMGNSYCWDRVGEIVKNIENGLIPSDSEIDIRILPQNV